MITAEAGGQRDPSQGRPARRRADHPSPSGRSGSASCQRPRPETGTASVGNGPEQHLPGVHGPLPRLRPRRDRCSSSRSTIPRRAASARTGKRLLVPHSAGPAGRSAGVKVGRVVASIFRRGTSSWSLIFAMLFFAVVYPILYHFQGQLHRPRDRRLLAEELRRVLPLPLLPALPEEQPLREHPGDASGARHRHPFRLFPLPLPDPREEPHQDPGHAAR